MNETTAVQSVVECNKLHIVKYFTWVFPCSMFLLHYLYLITLVTSYFADYMQHQNNCS